MKKTSLTVAMCAMVLCAGAALATGTPQETCDFARITAWKTYASCVDTVVAKDAKVSGDFAEFAAFAKCRHAYFKKWTGFQLSASLATSSCIGTRFTDNGDGTVTDHLSGLVWEKKTNDASVHGDDNSYSWSTWTTEGAASDKENGTTFTSFLATVNGGGGFAGANGWRLPTLAELQTIVADFACSGIFGNTTCSCGLGPCIDGTFGPTKAFDYWTATSYVRNPNEAWTVRFDGGKVNYVNKFASTKVRAVRGGL